MYRRYGIRAMHMYRTYGIRAMQELLPRSSTPVNSTDLFRLKLFTAPLQCISFFFSLFLDIKVKDLI